MKSTVFGALAILTLGALPALAQPNLLENPSFEDPTVTMGSANDVWFRFGSGASGVSSESTTMPRTGSRHIELRMVGPNQFAGVFQNLNMTINPGQVLNFMGWAKNASGNAFAATQEIKFEWQGMPNPPQNRLDVLTLGSDYEMFSHTGVAPANTTGVVITYAISSFGPGQGDSLVFIDDFKVTIVPEPAAVGLLGMGALGLLAFVRRRK